MKMGLSMGMFLSIIKIIPLPEMRKEVLDILDSVTGPTEAEAGCLECSVLEEYRDEGIISFIEHWRSEEEMNRHLRSGMYVRVLKAMELSQRPPEVKFFQVSRTAGLELIVAQRQAGIQEWTDRN